MKMTDFWRQVMPAQWWAYAVALLMRGKRK